MGYRVIFILTLNPKCIKTNKIKYNKSEMNFFFRKSILYLVTYVFLSLNICLAQKNQENQENSKTAIIDFKIEECKFPVEDTISGFGWFWEFKGNLLSAVCVLLNTSKTRVKIINGSNKYVNIKTMNNSDSIDAASFLLDILKKHYGFTVKEVVDTVEIWELGVLNDNILTSSGVKSIYDPEININTDKRIKSMNSDEQKRFWDSLYAMYPLKSIELDSVFFQKDNLCSLSTIIEKHSNTITECSIDGYDDTEIQIASDGAAYIKYYYTLWIKKGLFLNFDLLNDFLKQKGLVLKKKKKPFMLNLIEFPLSIKP
jgi:hypothetical protein